MSAEHPITQATTAASASEEGHKVFVGNLAFATTSEDLKALFADKGNVKDAQIIYRGRRSLGYGFVTYESEADAAAAIAAVNQTELNGRVVNCEIAKPPSNTRRGNIAQEAAQAAGGEASTEGHEVTGDAPRGGRRGRGRAARRGLGRRPAADGEAEPAGEITDQMSNLQVNGDASAARIDDSEAPADGEARGRRRPRGRGGRGGRDARYQRATRAKPLAGEESKTMVFVANLPFSYDNDALKNIFQGFNVVSATVVTRKRGPGEGKSKGFGFVEFGSQEEQQKAVEQFASHEVEGREINVKVALDTPMAQEQPETAHVE